MIELDAITVRYAGRPPVVALQGVSVRLQPGITHLGGPSGAGKSTLLRVVATLQPPDEGAVRYPWDGRWPSPVPSHVRSRVGYVPQENRLTQRLTCEGALRYLAAVRGLAAGRARVATLLARWGLTALAGTRLDRLSSGEARRWLLAQSQLGDPDLWLLDEPLAHLDAWAAGTLWAELARYARGPDRASPRYALVVSHDARVDGLAGAAIRLERGRLALA